jgi:hypothetical protein
MLIVVEDIKYAETLEDRFEKRGRHIFFNSFSTVLIPPLLEPITTPAEFNSSPPPLPSPLEGEGWVGDRKSVV